MTAEHADPLRLIKKNKAVRIKINSFVTFLYFGETIEIKKKNDKEKETKVKVKAIAFVTS